MFPIFTLAFAAFLSLLSPLYVSRWSAAAWVWPARVLQEATRLPCSARSPSRTCRFLFRRSLGMPRPGPLCLDGICLRFFLFFFCGCLTFSLLWKRNLTCVYLINTGVSPKHASGRPSRCRRRRLRPSRSPHRRQPLRWEARHRARGRAPAEERPTTHEHGHEPCLIRYCNGLR